MNPWVAIYRFAWVALIILAVIGLLCIFLPRIHGLSAMQSKKEMLQQENRLKEQRIMELKTAQQQFLSDPAYVELTARRMGMVKPDETVIRGTNRPTPNKESE
ncbi:MAG: septum formation initiator family protein [Lentisphaerae bacterium]|nr:septum formation initiator family protein [Lentisphaerota bacterium]